MAKDPLSAKVKALQDVLRKDAGIDGDAQRIAQISILFSLKALEGLANYNTVLKEAIPKNLIWSNLLKDSTFDQVYGRISDLRAFINQIDHLSVNSDLQILDSLKGVNVYFTSESVFRDSVIRIENLLGSRNQRNIGDVYEKILGDLQNAGNAGEFYTPRAITDFIAETLEIGNNDTIIDPACGTGGLLLSLADRFIRENKDFHAFGIEKKSLPYLMFSTNIIMHGLYEKFTSTNNNALAESAYVQLARDKFSVVVSNPPFGGIEEDEITKKNVTNLLSKDTSELFMSLILDLLDENGRAAVIIPDGFLGATGGKRRIREKLFRDFNLHTIVRLPPGVFAPYTGISTNILYFDKANPVDELWFVEHAYPDGIKKYSKTNPVRVEHLSNIVSWWNARSENEFAWKVMKSDISEDFNIDLKNPHKNSVIVKDYVQLEKEIDSIDIDINLKLQDLAGLLINFGFNDEQRTLKEIEGVLSQKNGANDLRGIFLSLAFTGNLLPASLKRLKDRGALQEYLKIDVRSANLLKENSHISTPMDWLHVTLDSIGSIVSGGTPKSDEEDYWGSTNEIPWLTPTDLYGMREKYISHGSRFITLEGMRNSSARMLESGSVLFSSRAPVGYVAIASSPLTTNQGFKSVIPFNKSLGEYIYYYLLAARNSIEARATGTTFKEVSTRQMRSTPISFPNLDAMKYIVMLLDRVFAIINEVEQAINRRIILQQDLSLEAKKRFIGSELN